MYKLIVFILASFAFASVPQFPRNHPENDPSKCFDIRPDCMSLASVGECQDNYNFIASQCKFTCKFCSPQFVCLNGDQVESKQHCPETFQMSENEAQAMRTYGQQASIANEALRNASRVFHSSKTGLQNPLFEKPNVNNMQSRIIDGCDLNPGSFPFFAQIVDVDSRSFCGGAVIGTRLIITAAHCLLGWSKLSPDVARFQIRTGSVMRNEGSVTTWSKIFIHESYLALTNDLEAATTALEKLRYKNLRRNFDIALAILVNPVPIAYTIPLATKYESSGDKGTLAGFGQINDLINDPKFPTVMQNINLTIEEDDDFNRDHCFLTNDKARSGDSGAPFFWDEDGKQVLGGLHIGTIKMNDGTLKSEFVRIKNYESWIRMIIKQTIDHDEL